MYIDNPVVKKPDDENSKIWRYLDFPKFLSLLHEKKLFFVQACKLPDRFEGRWIKTNTKLDEYFKEYKKFTCISSWQRSDGESALMWEVYPKTDYGIAIQSTFNRLRQSFVNEEKDIYCGEVNYNDSVLNSIPKNTLEPFLRKRIYFKEEQEIRAIYQEIDRGREKKSTIDLVNYGTYIIVDLDKLIEKIYISPKAEKWFHNLVQSVVNRYGLNKEVRPSCLGDIPMDSKEGDTSEKSIVHYPFGEISDASGNICAMNGIIAITNQKR
jgi:hypothetical protein